MHLGRAPSSRPKAILVRADALVPLGMETNETVVRVDGLQANVSIS